MNIRQSYCELLYSPVLAGGIFALLMVSPMIAAQANGPNVKQLNTDEMRETLEMLVTQIHANYEAIKTWEGVYEFVDEVRFSGKIRHPDIQEITDNQERSPTEPSSGSGHVEITRGVGEFALDSAEDLRHVFHRPTGALEILDLASGRRWQRTAPGDAYHWTVTSEHFLTFGIGDELGQVDEFPLVPSVALTGGRIVYRRSPSKTRYYLQVVDPRAFFGNGSKLFWEYCESYARTLRGERTEREKEFAMRNASIVQRTSQTGMEYVMTVKFPQRGVEEPKDAVRRTEITFDSSVGFNPTLWSQTQFGRAMHKRTIAYEEVAGIFVPKRFEVEFFDRSQPDLVVPVFSRTLTLLESKLNNPIDPGHFTIDRFDLQYGERMIDEIENRMYVKDQSGFVPVEEFVFDPTLIPGAIRDLDAQGGGIGAMLIIINVAIVLVLVVVILLRRRNQAA